MQVVNTLKINKKTKAKKKKSVFDRLVFRIKVVNTVAILAFVAFVAVTYINRCVMPSVRTISQTYASKYAAQVMDMAIMYALEDRGVKTGDLSLKSMNGQGKVVSISANTVVINNICAQMSFYANQKMGILKNEGAYIRLGGLSGVDFLKTKGPRLFRVDTVPIGDCNVLYKTSFDSKGINQVNYQVWIEATANIQIISPFSEDVVSIQRNFPLINEYINADIPSSMPYPMQGGR